MRKEFVLKENLYKIGKVSSLLGISIGAIRHYEKEGLIIPCQIDYKSSFRYYNDHNIHELWRIDTLRSAGFSLQEIGEMNTLDLTDISPLLEQKSQLLEREISKKKIALSYINRQRESLSIFKEGASTMGSLKRISDRWGQALVATDNRSAFEHYTLLRSARVGPGLSLDMQFQPSRLLRLEGDHFTLDSLFALDEREEKFVESKDRIRGGLYYCRRVVNWGGKNPSYLQQMLSSIESLGKTPRGDALEILLVDGILNSQSDLYIREIQIALED